MPGILYLLNSDLEKIIIMVLGSSKKKGGIGGIIGGIIGGLFGGK